MSGSSSCLDVGERHRRRRGEARGGGVAGADGGLDAILFREEIIDLSRDVFLVFRRLPRGRRGLLRRLGAEGAAQLAELPGERGIGALQNAGLSLGEEIEQRAAARGFGGLERLFGLVETHEELGPQFVSRAGAHEERRALILALDAAALQLVQRNRGLYIGKRLLDVALSGLDAGDDEKARGLAGRIADAVPQRESSLKIGQRAGKVAHAFAHGAAVVQGQSLAVHAASLLCELEQLV